MHPLQNGSQVTERPANKPISGLPGYFTESGDNNVPSYPGQDWFNDVIDEFLNALNEQGINYVPGETDHLAKMLEKKIGGKVAFVTDGIFNPPSKNPTYGEDWTDAINQADEYCYQNGLTLVWVPGQYCCTSNVQWKSKWASFTKAPELAPFPQLDDDKRFLSPGKKSKMPGVTLFFQSGTYQSIATQRTDLFSTLKPCVKTTERYSVGLSGGIAIVQDMDVFDEQGELTSVATDNRSVGLDVGLLLDDCSASDLDNLVVFGYFNRAGTVIWSHGAGDNPDYIKFGFGSTSGYFGLAMIGNDLAAGDGPGISGTQFYGFQLFANDHHSRSPQPLQSYQTNAYGHLLFADGKTAAVNADINGHEFIGGGWRTYSNAPVVLDHCSNMHLTNVPFEFSEVAGQPDTGNQRFKATANTRNFVVHASRNCMPNLWAHAEFGGVIKELCIQSDNFGGTWWGHEGQYVGVISTGGGQEPRIVFTDNPASSESGFTMRKDIPSGAFEIRKDSQVKQAISNEGLIIDGSPVSIPLDSGRLDATSSNVLIRSEIVGSSDVLTNIHPEIEGAVLTVKRGVSSENITIKDGSGIPGENIRTPDGINIELDNSFKLITLKYIGGFWLVS